MRATLLLVIAIALLVGCKGQNAETRAREAAEKIKESIPDVESKALAQKVTPEQVREAQEGLRAANEYLGEVNGKLDPVTVNSIEAFQRAHGLEGDGMLNDRTMRLLRKDKG